MNHPPTVLRPPPPPAPTTHANFVCAGPGIGAPLRRGELCSATVRGQQQTYPDPDGKLGRGGIIHPGGGCVNVGVGYWGAGGTVSETSTLARSQCESGLTTIGSGAGADEVGDCGRVLNVNGEKIYLRSTKKTTPSLNVSINGDVFYGNMGASGIGALKLKSNGTTYSVYDDSMQ